MIGETFLQDYFSIILFLVIALLLSIGFITLNFMLSPKILILKNYHLTNAVSNLLMTPEWNLM